MEKEKNCEQMLSLSHNQLNEKNSTLINYYALFLSVFFIVCGIIALIIYSEENVFSGIFSILISPAKLVTDYFALGGLASTLFNAGICGLIANFIILLSKAKSNSTTFAAYLLIVAHCFYGLNFLNMWPSIIGVLLYCIVMKKKFSENVHIALFSTALSPFISDFLFRYFQNITSSSASAMILGIVLAIIFGIISGFIVPALIPETAKMHRGYNMYKAGLAIGILGIFLHSFFYISLGIKTPDPINIDNTKYYSMPYGYRAFMNIFFIVLFTLTLIMGYLLNNKSFSKYSKLLKSTGYGVDFVDKFGMEVCLINFALYGLSILAYLNIIFVLPEIFSFLPKGVGFTGATAGVIFAALTFSADGQQPRTVAPIMLGYVLLSIIVCSICLIFNMDVPWTLSTQAYINGLAFATGLCPFAGKYGFKIGLLAGFLSAIICTATADMHGGFVLYNGGFSAGLAALVLLPILDFYKIKPKFDDDIIEDKIEQEQKAT